MINSESWDRHEADLPADILVRLGEAMSAVRQVVEAQVVNESAVTDLVRAWNLLDHVTDALPDVNLWCVVKHYRAHLAETGSWRPAVWVACTTKAQADEFATAIHEHYVQENAWRGSDAHDTFVSERADARVSQIVDPNLSAEAYVAGLMR